MPPFSLHHSVFGRQQGSRPPEKRRRAGQARDSCLISLFFCPVDVNILEKGLGEGKDGHQDFLPPVPEVETKLLRQVLLIP